ncbi:hypothetical protein RhiirC2_771257 [Rhizophagus irregularis]|uniref:Uncharacterized protein n=1 Tax=Rhizophagus irregularis TaxID=588596 RepID=A0A2N1NJC4_9GLOM|nr:hypothetical protein RhiirC2_775309 [Rhizophagus irregularis]PKK77500.1 hypothetical protein RhiirC2_771257 [Rhizophagus irregularis]
MFCDYQLFLRELYDSKRFIISCRGEYLDNFFISCEKIPILLSKFTDEAIDWINKLFDELEGYWNKLFLKEGIIKENKNILGIPGRDEKSDYQSAIINYSVKLFQLLPNDMLHEMGFINQKLDAIIKSCRKEIEVDEPLPHDMLTSMIIKNTFRDDNYIETGEVNRSMTDDY